MADSGHDAHPPADAPRPGAGHRALRWLIEAAVILVGAVVIATLLRTFVAQMFVIPSTSMENTLQVHDRILVAKFGGFQRGDVVVFEDPGTGWVQPNPTPTASRGRSSSSAYFPTRAQDTSSSARSACPATTSGSTIRD